MKLRPLLDAWLSRTTLLQQLQTAALVIATLIGIPAAAALLLGEYHTARDALVQNLRIQSRIVATNSSAATAFNDAIVAAEVLSAVKSSPNVVAVQLLRNDGSVLAGYRPGGRDHRRSPWTEQFELREPVAYRNQTYGELVMTGDYADLNRRLALFMIGTVALVVAAVLLAIAAFRRALEVLMRPVERLVALMRRVSEQNNYSLRSDISLNNELGQIAQSFNSMLEQIESRDSALARELEERRQTEKRLAYLATHDPLTGLGNRNAFMQQMERNAADLQTPLCVQLLDVDHFKLVNDSLGHHAGDNLLAEVGSRLASLRSDRIEVFRIGGDEFAVLMRDCSDAASAQQLAASITEAIGAPFRIVGQELFTSLSIGIALRPEHAQTTEALLNCADLALYEAKSLGRDRWALFSPHLKANLEQRIRLEADLRRALERDELFLVFEPQMTLTDHRLAGMEALVRWQHPELGVLEPSHFIPLAEETGLINRLGEWVLRRACVAAISLRSVLGPGAPRIAVNLSPRQLADPSIAEVVRRALTDSGLPGEALELEVTESVMIEKLDLVSDRMRAIAGLGVSFAMDDFGVGASSLSYLRRLPLSKIKIDRCFVRELPHNEDDAAVAAAIATLGLRLGIPVLAEGVETPAQLSCLRDMGCSTGQGYLFARPKPLPEFTAYLVQQSVSAPAAAPSHG